MFLNLFSKNFYPVISDYAKVLIPSVITSFVTRYSLNRPRKYDIRKRQFEEVYLPLYLLTKQLLTADNYQENLSLFAKKFNKIVYANYPLVYPKTIKLFKKLISSHSDGKRNTYHLANFESQINTDYEKLKRELGYPTNSFFDFFKRLSGFNKIMYGLFICISVFTIWAIIDSFLFFMDGDMLNAVSALFSAVVMSFLLYIFSYPIRH